MGAPFVVADRCAETTSTVGVGTLTLTGAVQQYQTFASGVDDGQEVDYCILSGDSSGWEVGRGTVTVGASTTLSRDTVYASSNSDARVSLSGTSRVFVDASARFLTRDQHSSKIADYEILAAESSMWFDNTDAAGAVVLTLPAAEAGLRFGFMVDTAQQLTVTAQAGESIAAGTVNSAAGGTVASNAPYSAIELRCHKTGQWVASAQTGSWTVT